MFTLSSARFEIYALSSISALRSPGSCSDHRLTDVRDALALDDSPYSGSLSSSTSTLQFYHFFHFGTLRQPPAALDYFGSLNPNNLRLHLAVQPLIKFWPHFLQTLQALSSRLHLAVQPSIKFWTTLPTITLHPSFTLVLTRAQHFDAPTRFLLTNGIPHDPLRTH